MAVKPLSRTKGFTRLQNPPRQASPADRRRTVMIAKIHLGAKEIGLAEDDRRELMRRVTGKSSAGDMNEFELGMVLDELRAKGWKQAAPQGRVRQADHPSAKKARAMWISLANLGVVRNPHESALEAFAARQLGVERLQWADRSHCYSLIEALKVMAGRAGWSQSIDNLQRKQADASDVIILKRRLVRCQIRKLFPLAEQAGQLAAVDKIKSDESALDAVIAELGVKIRAVMDAAIA